jgi:hypothetical protein
MLDKIKRLLGEVKDGAGDVTKQAIRGHRLNQERIGNLLGMNQKYGYKGIDRPTVPFTEILKNGPQEQVPFTRLEYETLDRDVTPKKFQPRGADVLDGQMRGGRPIGVGDAVPMPQFDMREPMLNLEGTQLYGMRDGEYGPMYNRNGVDERILINGRRKRNIFEEI